MRAADLNPIRTYSPADMPDYLTKFPNLENITYGEAYVYGINASLSCIRRHVGVLYLQFIAAATIQYEVWKYVEGVWIFISVNDSDNISPVGWTGLKVHKITLDLPDGIYYLKYDNVQYSDVFEITSDENITEDFIKIEYRHSYNNFACIFGENYFTSYYIGQLLPDKPKNNIESQELDGGGVAKLKSVVQKTVTLTIKNIHYSYLYHISTIFACDMLTINGVEYENSDDPEWEAISGGDTGNISVKLTQKLNDYCHG